MRLKLDLHEIYNKSRDLDRALNDLIDEAEETGAKKVEIIPGKGSGALKKRVLRFLERKDIKARYHRVEKDNKNSDAYSCISNTEPGRRWAPWRHQQSWKSLTLSTVVPSNSTVFAVKEHWLIATPVMFGLYR